MASSKVYTDDTIAVIKDFYLTNDIDFPQMSQMSEEIFGFSISLDDIKRLSREDGGWEKQRQLDSPEQKFKNIADHMYKIAMNEGEDGEKGKTPASVSVQAAKVFMQAQALIGGSKISKTGTAASDIDRLAKEADKELDEYHGSLS